MYKAKYSTNYYKGILLDHRNFTTLYDEMNPYNSHISKLKFFATGSIIDLILIDFSANTLKYFNTTTTNNRASFFRTLQRF